MPQKIWLGLVAVVGWISSTVLLIVLKAVGDLDWSWWQVLLTPLLALAYVGVVSLVMIWIVERGQR